ncbi:MAG: hypothetical protein ACR2L2_15330 [Acidobacteriota bacterium]
MPYAVCRSRRPCVGRRRSTNRAATVYARHTARGIRHMVAACRAASLR